MSGEAKYKILPPGSEFNDTTGDWWVVDPPQIIAFCPSKQKAELVAAALNAGDLR